MITLKRQELSMPVVNLNGTSRQELQTQCRGTLIALDNLHEELQQMMPHGRDYQTVGFERYELARSQHMDRLRSVENMQEEIRAIYESLIV